MEAATGFELEETGQVPGTWRRFPGPRRDHAGSRSNSRDALHPPRRLAAAVGILNDALRGRDYLLGSEFSVADLNVATVVFVLGTLGHMNLGARILKNLGKIGCSGTAGGILHALEEFNALLPPRKEWGDADRATPRAGAIQSQLANSRCTSENRGRVSDGRPDNAHE